LFEYKLPNEKAQQQIAITVWEFLCVAWLCKGENQKFWKRVIERK